MNAYSCCIAESNTILNPKHQAASRQKNKCNEPFVMLHNT